MAEVTMAEEGIAAQVHAVAQAAYALEAERIGCTEFPPLRESEEDLRRCADRFLVFRKAGRVVAALSFVREADAAEITRLVVSPAHWREGIATALLEELERRLPEGMRIEVETARANEPAIGLYRRTGYAEAGGRETGEGISLIRLAKVNARGG